MSIDPSSEPNLRSLFENALREYEKQAGTNLLNDRLIVKLQTCDSVDAISAVIQDQAQAFHTFRGDDGKLIRWLKRTVHALHMLSTSGVLGAAVSLVRWNYQLEFPFVGRSSDIFYAAISTSKCHIRRNRCPSHRRCFLIGLIGQDLTMFIVFRRSKTSAPATMPLSTYSNRQRTF